MAACRGRIELHDQQKAKNTFGKLASKAIKMLFFLSLFDSLRNRSPKQKQKQKSKNTFGKNNWQKLAFVKLFVGSNSCLAGKAPLRGVYYALVSLVVSPYNC